MTQAFGSTRDPTRDVVCQIRSPHRRGEKREGEGTRCFILWLLFRFHAMAEPEKKRRISHANSSQVSSILGNRLSGHRLYGAEVEGYMEGSILRITMTNFL